MRIFSIPIFSKILGEVSRSRTSPLITIDLAGPVIRRARFILSSSKAQSIIVERLPSRSAESFFSSFRSERSPGDANRVCACCCLPVDASHPLPYPTAALAQIAVTAGDGYRLDRIYDRDRKAWAVK